MIFHSSVKIFQSRKVVFLDILSRKNLLCNFRYCKNASKRFSVMFENHFLPFQQFFISRFSRERIFLLFPSLSEKPKRILGSETRMHSEGILLIDSLPSWCWFFMCSILSQQKFELRKSHLRHPRTICKHISRQSPSLRFVFVVCKKTRLH